MANTVHLNGSVTLLTKWMAVDKYWIMRKTIRITRMLITSVGLFMLYACGSANFNPKWISEKAPESFSATFETSKGSFDIQITRSLSPLAADRLYQLINHHYFDGSLFYRVVPNFVAQFGSLDTLAINKWERYKVYDEPVRKSNLKGTLSFARSGKDTRGTQLYINLRDNSRLDSLSYEGVVGFPVIGEVTRGMNVVESLYSGYGDSVFEKFDSLSADKKEFLKRYPDLDSIRTTSILKAKK